ncbi:hypothetical protein [Clostridium perfringens]|uniref:hypothetical protein n=1 Tax=Clostridium perfringens TaxID=1502 RepID=UPI0028677E27|nr:hypothetical protein [Clostridium perfringens]
MIPYYILETEHFDTTISTYSADATIQITHEFKDSPPQIFYEKSYDNSFKDFLYYKLKVESIAKLEGRAYGRSEPFWEFIKITNKEMFYNENNKILILKTSKDTYNSFVSCFSKDDHDTKLKFSTKRLNFKSVIESGYSKGVQGVWFGNIKDTQLKNEALYGSTLEASERYKELLDNGATITNISLSVDYNNTNIKIMLTKECGIILYTNKCFNEEKEVLDFIIFIYQNLIKPNTL